MKKKLFRLALVLAILFAASMLYLNKKMEEQKDPYNVSTVLDDKGVKLYKRGFRLLENHLRVTRMLKVIYYLEVK
jgi:hypothetical protein